MFTLDQKQARLISDGTPVQWRKDPNSQTGLKISNLVIKASGGPSLPNAIEQYISSGRSVHLLIDKNGSEIAQMVDLNRVAFHTDAYDKTSVGIDLIYPGRLTESPGKWNSKDRYNPREMIFAQSINDNKEHWWPFHPQEQLDTLLEITKLIDQEFGLERIHVRFQLEKFDLNSGPAFPINRLRQLVAGETSDQELYEETSSVANLFIKPGVNGLKVLDQPLPANTPIAINAETEDGEWVLVEVMAMLGDRRWTVGWMEASKVKAKEFEPKVNANHFLVTADGRRIRYIKPHEKNFNPNKKLDPRYVVIHFTTGTTVQSIIHTFQDPNEGTSAHLVVGRNGRVVQMVPFDQTAFHCGTSTWEGKTNLNLFAIGIEIDNAGDLRTTRRGFKKKDKLIPTEQVESKRHWKEFEERPWQKFTEEQVQVVQKIVKALKAHYPGIQEIVGHDMVNLLNRLDPGPLYPLGELREAILGDKQQTITHYITRKECPIYENLGFKPPNLPHPDFGELPANSKVNVKDPQEKWTLVTVKISSNPQLRNKTGWILSSSITPDKDTSKTKFPQKLYIKDGERLPPLPIDVSPLRKGDHVRIQFTVGDQWALVAPVLKVREDADGLFEIVVPEDEVERNYLEGWVERSFITKLTRHS